MPLYSLTHVNDQPIPTPLSVDGASYLITAATVHIEPPQALTRELGADGALSFDVHGARVAGSTPERLTFGRYLFRTVAPGRLEFPGQSGRLAHYIAQVRDNVLVLTPLREHALRPDAVHILEAAGTWRFQLSPGAEPESRFRATLSGGMSDWFEVRVGDREIPWLSRLLTAVATAVLGARARARRWYRLLRRPHN